MNYIDRLVAELCPDGVEYRPLKEVTQKVKSIKWDKSDGKQYEYIDLSSIPTGGFTITETTAIDAQNAPSRARQIIHAGDVLFGSTRPLLNRVAVVPAEYDGQICSTGYSVIRVIDNLVLPSFVFHVLRSISFRTYVEQKQTGAAYPAITSKAVLEYLIPVPPLEIQEAIIEILDKFTNLEAELEAELEARTLQYKYYRDSLFEALDCPRVPLGSLGIRNKGIAITASKMRTLEPGNKDVRIFAAGATFVDTDSSFIPDKGILEGPAIIVKSRGHIGFEYYEGKFTHKNELWSYSLTSDLVEQKFIYYYLLTQAYYLHELARGKSVKLPQLAVKDTDELLVPIPSLEEQQRIVDILDRFDALTSSLSEGLPAELAARRSQYEYYRDQLLTFPRKGENQ